MQILDKAEKKESHLIYMGTEYPHLDRVKSERELLVAFKYRHAEFPSLDHMRHSHIIQ